MQPFIETNNFTGCDNFVDRTFWAQVCFTRDTRGQVTGFIYKLLQEFAAEKLTR
ncbi:MAG: hypothetical protein LAP85_00955 [Acidobacteriia bacterium]|nr:hypothetical protein [Terriglobia bacterium]